MASTKSKGLIERLNGGETLICAEGYLFQFERRGYLKAGAFVPEVVIDHPELVRQQYEEYVHAGSDVVLAFTYYAHRAKLSVIDREKDIEKMNRDALKMAREVADNTGTLMAGNISNSTAYNPEDPEWEAKITAMFKEQIEWAADAGADFMIGETYGDLAEAMLALKCIKTYGKGMPAVINMAVHRTTVNGKAATLDGVELTDAMKQLEAAGADVVGLNCARGPATMLPLLEEMKKVVKVPIAALPVVYRTSDEEPNFQALTDPLTGEKLFPINLDCMQCNRADIIKFGKRCSELGIQFIGLCCGNSAHYTRALAESVGKQPSASRYSPNLEQHFALGKLQNNKSNSYNLTHVKSNF